MCEFPSCECLRLTAGETHAEELGDLAHSCWLYDTAVLYRTDVLGEVARWILLIALVLNEFVSAWLGRTHTVGEGLLAFRESVVVGAASFSAGVSLLLSSSPVITDQTCPKKRNVFRNKFRYMKSFLQYS